MFDNLLQRWLDQGDKVNEAARGPTELLPRFLHGVDLREYTFLGISKLTYTWGEDSEYAAVFHFCGRADSNNRMLVIPPQLSAPTIDFTKHEWYVMTGSMWLAGEVPLYQGINLYVTDHLKNFMAVLHDHEWNARDAKWQPIIRDPYDGVTEVDPWAEAGAKVKIIKPGKPIVHRGESDANGDSKVITVNFKKDSSNGIYPDPTVA